jgi:predicted ATPase
LPAPRAAAAVTSLTRAAIAPVYGLFTEGSDTRDLKEAKALLTTNFETAS